MSILKGPAILSSRAGATNTSEGGNLTSGIDRVPAEPPGSGEAHPAHRRGFTSPCGSSGASTSRHGGCTRDGAHLHHPGSRPTVRRERLHQTMPRRPRHGWPRSSGSLRRAGGRQRNDVGATTLVQQPNRSRPLICKQIPPRSLECYGSACFDPLDSDLVLVPV
jgi:hypothetical protein